MNEPVRPATAPRRRRAAKTAAAADTPAAETGRTNDPEATMADILDVATREFAAKGLAGARIDEIAAATRTSKRMIYYYFGSKEGLYLAVLEELYRKFNEAESRLALDLERPVEALADVVRFVWNYYRHNPEFITLLNTENLHRGRHIAKSPRAGEYSSPAMKLLDRVLERGIALGQFRRTANARDTYLMIAALGYFYLSNRYTLTTFLGERVDTPEAFEHWEAFMVDAVRRAVAPPDELPRAGS